MGEWMKILSIIITASAIVIIPFWINYRKEDRETKQALDDLKKRAQEMSEEDWVI